MHVFGSVSWEARFRLLDGMMVKLSPHLPKQTFELSQARTIENHYWKILLQNLYRRQNELAEARQRTIFVLNASHIREVLGKWEIYGQAAH
jgi:hypothetical protein